MKKKIPIILGLFLLIGVTAYVIYQKNTSCAIKGNVAPFENIAFENMYVVIGQNYFDKESERTRKTDVKKGGSYCFKEFNHNKIGARPIGNILPAPILNVKNIGKVVKEGDKRKYYDKEGNLISFPKIEMKYFYWMSVFEKETDKLLYMGLYYADDKHFPVNINYDTSIIASSCIKLGRGCSYEQWQDIINAEIPEVKEYEKFHSSYTKENSIENKGEYNEAKKAYDKAHNAILSYYSKKYFKQEPK